MTFMHSHQHGLATIIGYRVRRTYFDSTPHSIEAVFASPYEYASAIEVAHSIRNEPNHAGYAVVDMVYACGCDSS